MRRTGGAAALLAAAALVAGCAAADDGIRLPPRDGVLDYQLGGAYAPAPEVTIVVRDRTEAPADGAYGVCYVNLFQTQPDPASGPDPALEGTTAWWDAVHPELLLRDADGALVVDEEWNEALFDIRTAATREALLQIQSAWLRGCADDGYDAVEPDNLDQHERSHGLQTLDHALAYMAEVIPLAHRLGLAVAQKNTAELGTSGPELGFDFAVAEECELHDECADYRYPGRVLEIEYDDTGAVERDGTTRTAFEWACARRSGDHPITLRDRDATPRGDPAHVFAHC
ncbi:endo alpha-1,4 polygalactosaminidase [Microbacterium sp. JZ37]|uniref:endo alpha-1,4 polygalactosaminidase n=1 Tax=Microbacterium sp. JZ37 TaxID=2654193 RepID=UPI002B48CAF9|nr:endo alpha-1,4 polygalactosaminidase [Microbacterium sp. JZ37]WRH18654.1 hypothetical protein GC092_14770 [Microbacterium sp. JZ37]